MARRPREDAPGAAHHVMIRGIERRPIFLDDTDCEEFLGRLSRLVRELGFRCFAWALMSNHAHLVLRSAQTRISVLMARLGTGYARYFNQRHARVGHLFQNRFRSRLVTDDADLMGLVLYVTRNPLEAGLVPDVAGLEQFPWCGLGGLLGERVARPFEAIDETLALFAVEPGLARRRLRGRILAAPPGDETPLRSLAAAERPPAPLPISGFEELVREISAAHGVRPEELGSRSRTPRLATARAALAARAAEQLGLSASSIARRLGLTPAAVSAMLVRRRSQGIRS